MMLSLPACVAPLKGLYPADSCADVKTIYLVSHGWHTGIVIDSNDLQGYLGDVKQDFLESRYLEIGWGDRGFYQANEITSGLSLQAIFWPTEAILHVVGLLDTPMIEFPASEIIQVQVSSEGYRNLLRYIDSAFVVNNEKIVKLQNGLYGWSHFYDAKGRYHLFNTCNNWVARGLRKTGFPISSFYSATAGNVMFQVKQYAWQPLQCF